MNQPQIEVILGFLEKPCNSEIVKSKYLPSKVGGKPVYLNILSIIIYIYMYRHG